MGQRFLTPSAVVVMITKICLGQTYVLLQRRKNTGFADGLWDLSCSGHVEDGESMTDACVRECAEELGIHVAREDLKFFTLIHKRDKECNLVYYNGYFYLNKYEGQPTVCEHDKCSQICWFNILSLPEDIIPDRRAAIEAYIAKVPYLEYGWK